MDLGYNSRYNRSCSSSFSCDYVGFSGEPAKYFSFMNECYENLPGPDLEALRVYEEGGDRAYKSLGTS
ncbi:MAG: hypothetical protein KKC38_02225 [Nanoarchaeota archaeon]|nr:hypothetical protein [Nanoarchaeota archaeon]